MRIIHVGSKNQTKVQAVKNVFTLNGPSETITVAGIDIEIEEYGHPKNVQETIQGAKERARAAFAGSDLAVGLESGLLEASEAATGYLETTACALYDGQRYSVGMGPSFEWPKEVLRLILSGLDGSQAFKEAGLTDHEKLGAAEGAIHTLTQGAMDRTRLNELAIMMALIQLHYPEQY